MEAKKEHMIPIWFFIGINMLVYGVVILATGLVMWNSTDTTVHMADKHPAVWWGAMMTVLGVLYTVKFRPGTRSAMDAPPTDHIAEKGTKFE